MLREVARPKFKDLICWGTSDYPKEFDLSNFELVGSGKGAITLILKYLTEQGILQNKMDEILVPDWLGYWVYNQMQPFAFPVRQYSPRTKILFVYHQYGFPQNMDEILAFAKEKKLIIIEDCAHTLSSYYKNQLVGTFGDFALYSFSKWFFCFALGAVTAKRADFNKFAKQAIKQTPWGLTFFKDLSKLIYERSTFAGKPWFEKNANLLLSQAYALYSQALKPSHLAKKLLHLKLDHEIKVRQKRYQYFRQATDQLGIGGHLEGAGVTPYVIPLIAPKNKIQILTQDFIHEDIQTGIYHFDLNRNLLNPNFTECVLLPCHAGISDAQFENIINIIKKRFSA